ncbi:MAG: DEAD/DEAH box helicase family protein [Candidatus Micrarchaeota archaeon]|nr:DEAD/DEAH box helicase family protein [Candidatus Micrarchaeota archaeon]
MISLKPFQEKTVEELKEKVNKLLKYDDRKVCVFEAPTGSGKTLMVAEFLKRLVLHRDDDKKIAFIWISVRQLSNQSREKLEKYFEDTRILHCCEFEDLTDKRIGNNEILFFNWESINKEDNIYIRENEQENNLSTVIANTKEDGIEIVLIIDESHHTATSEKSIEIIEEAIAPKITLEVSATPKITKMDEKVTVQFEDVIADGMIKKEVAINPNIDKEKVGADSQDDIVISCALKKRKELENAYKKDGANINPLVLIQISDNRSGVLDKKDDLIKLLKDKFKITFENRKLAIYLSDKDDKVNLENIEKPDNETEVLIFKQAIAVGWDCPRAAILVLFRDWKSITFSIQTVGRIMRMPEFKHYNNEVLNKGYVFTNLADIEIAQDITKDYLMTNFSRRVEDYKNIDITSIYLRRQRERTRLTGEFKKLFIDIAKRELIKTRISLKPTELSGDMMVDGLIKKLDKVQIVEHKGELTVPISENDLQYRFDLFARSACSPFAPTRSSEIIRNSIYKFFEDVLRIDDWTKVQIIVLSKGNNDVIKEYINEAKESYKTKVIGQLGEKKEIEREPWNVPEDISYNSKYTEAKCPKSVMQPYFTKTPSKPEKEFIDLLDSSSNKVKWWFKNGESEKNFFAVLYNDDNGVEHGFYIDFIVMLKDGRIGLFDTKSGITAKVAKEKAEALANYIEDQNKRHGKKLFGGIAIIKDGSWRYNGSKTYTFDEKNLGKDWEFLAFS